MNLAATGRLKRSVTLIEHLDEDGNVIEADTRVSYYHRNPLFRLWHKLTGRTP